MKNTILILSLVVLTTFCLQAQSRFYVGANASYNMHIIVNQNNYGQKEMDYKDPQLAAYFGGQVGMRFNPNHAVSLGLMSMKLGQDYEDGFNNAGYEKDLQFNYIGIPILYTFTSGDERNQYEGAKFFLEVGPQINLLRSGTVTLDRNGSDDFLDFYTKGYKNPHVAKLKEYAANRDVNDVKEMFSGSDIMARFGFGVSTIFAESLQLTVALRGGISITDINAEDWKLENNDGVYEASRNAYAGLELRLNYLF